MIGPARLTAQVGRVATRLPRRAAGYAALTRPTGCSARLTVRGSARRFGDTTNVSGFRTRQPCGFFVPAISTAQNRFLEGRVDRAEYKTPRGNKPSRLTSVVETRLPATNWQPLLKRKEAAMATQFHTRSAPALQTNTLTTVTFPAGQARYVVCVGSGAECGAASDPDKARRLDRMMSTVELQLVEIVRGEVC